MHSHRDRQHKICLPPHRKALSDFDHEQKLQHHRGPGGDPPSAPSGHPAVPTRGPRREDSDEESLRPDPLVRRCDHPRPPRISDHVPNRGIPGDGLDRREDAQENAADKGGGGQGDIQEASKGDCQAQVRPCLQGKWGQRQKHIQLGLPNEYFREHKCCCSEL